MNRLKIFAATCILIVLCSCSKYQYVYIGSNLKKDNQSKYVNENDTFSLKYSFQGQNCPITIDIKNKLQRPLYVNWKNSAIIMDNQTLTLWDYINTSDNYTVEKSDKTDSLQVNPESQPKYSNLPITEATFVPPQSSASFYLLDLTSKFFELLPQDSMVKEKYNTVNGSMNLRRYLFQKENTPFRFRIYLTLSTHQTFNNPIVTDDTFWISDIITSLSSLNSDGGNQFYMSETTGMGNFLSITGTIALVTALEILDDGRILAQ